MSIYFDTNFFYRIVDREIDTPLLDKIKKFAEERDILLQYSPITFVEVARHINDKEQENFSRYQRVLMAIRELCGNCILKYPEVALARILGVEPRPVNDEHDLNKFRDLICSVNSYKELIKDDNGKRCVKLVKVFNKSKAKWRKQADKFVHQLNPHYARYRKKRSVKRIPREEREEWLNSLESLNFKQTCVDCTLYKVTSITEKGFIGTPSESITETLISRMSAYFAAYKVIAKKVINEGYKVKSNDFDDVHLLTYLNFGADWRFVSYDNPLKGKIQESPQRQQIMTLEELLGT